MTTITCATFIMAHLRCWCFHQRLRVSFHPLPSLSVTRMFVLFSVLSSGRAMIIKKKRHYDPSADGEGILAIPTRCIFHIGQDISVSLRYDKKRARHPVSTRRDLDHYNMCDFHNGSPPLLVFLPTTKSREETCRQLAEIYYFKRRFLSTVRNDKIKVAKTS